jgi:hypothetical protein
MLGRFGEKLIETYFLDAAQLIKDAFLKVGTWSRVGGSRLEGFK